MSRVTIAMSRSPRMSASTQSSVAASSFLSPVRVESAGRQGPAAIKMDVTEDDKTYIVHAEIPGVNKDEIQVTIEGNQVTLGADAKREKELKDGQRTLRSERYYGALYRSF